MSCTCAVTSVLKFGIRDHSYVTVSISDYVYQKENSIYLQLKINCPVGVYRQERGVGAEDTIFIEFINIFKETRKATKSIAYFCVFPDVSSFLLFRISY